MVESDRARGKRIQNLFHFTAAAENKKLLSTAHYISLKEDVDAMKIMFFTGLITKSDELQIQSPLG